MALHPALVVCEHCDSVYRRRALGDDEIARCTRCDAVLYRASRLDVDHLLALTLTAAIVFVIANVCPVIRIAVGGMHNEATLLQSISALSQGSALVVGLVAAMTLFVVPLLQIALLCWVLPFARANRRAPGFVPAMRVLHRIRPWSMTEVFLLGVLVAIVKLSGVLNVIPGPGTYATVALTVLATLIAKRDVHLLWERLPAGAHAQGRA
ncbi:paraquat-inducible protein A [Dokdonella ginsengisoli]|uniref:Paraquat-inducible protein A n=1 Tax=Dokdonella ginsengisoli TaxID=363846 RepID=A0ABV9QUA2_9GAMM